MAALDRPETSRRSLFAALLAAPVVALPLTAGLTPPLRPGNVWVQVPADAWNSFLKAARHLDQLGAG